MSNFLNKIKSEVTHETGKIVSGVKSGAQKVSHEAHVMDAKIGHGVLMAKADVDTAIGKAKYDIKKDIGKVDKELSKVKQEAIQGIKNIPDDLSKAGNYVKGGLESAGGLIADLEKDALPSFNKIIGETALVIAGVVAVAIVAFKVV